MNKFGVIDLGTNTFHLLIVQRRDNQITELFRERVFVKLAAEGIRQIGPSPYQRALDCLLHYGQVLEKHQITKVKAIGTAALRRANNGPQFIAEVKDKTGIHIEVISGDREAQLIHRGVSLAVPLSQHKGLIMDIGGGSVEYIIANQGKVFWAQSFPIGVALLFHNFHHEDPITEKEQQSLHQHLHSVLQPLINELKHHRIDSLIGASGTFDVIETFLGHKTTALYSEVNVEAFIPLKDRLIATTLAERLQISRLPASRAEMIVVALLLIDFTLSIAHPKQIITSSYAMKEGMLWEMMQI
ncbi:MAG: exopolyphosphatase [Bacteroidota bacterium]